MVSEAEEEDGVDVVEEEAIGNSVLFLAEVGYLGRDVWAVRGPRIRGSRLLVGNENCKSL